MGLANYYHKFVPQFSEIAAPLTGLTKGGKRGSVEWSQEALKAFEQLKQALCSIPILYSPDFSKDFVLQTDNSS